MEQISRQTDQLREELQSLDCRMEGLTSTVKQMILDEQLVGDFNLSLTFIEKKALFRVYAFVIVHCV